MFVHKTGIVKGLSLITVLWHKRELSMNGIFATLLLALIALSADAFSAKLARTSRALAPATRLAPASTNRLAPASITRLFAEEKEGGGPTKRRVIKYDNLGDPIYEGEGNDEGGGLNVLGAWNTLLRVCSIVLFQCHTHHDRERIE